MLLVALAGLIAMHGLSDHGVGGPAVSSPMSSTRQDATSTQSDMRLSVATIGTSSPGTADAGHLSQDAAAPGSSGGAPHSDVGGTSGGQGDHGGMLAGMCLAVMAGTLALAVAAWRARLRSALNDLLPNLNPITGRMWRARSWGPAPPDLRLLSIQRC